MSSEATLTAEEKRLRWTVGFLAVSALATRLARIGGIYDKQRETVHSRFVRDLGAKIGIGPTAVRSSLRLLQPYPRSEVRQVFDRWSATRRGRLLDNLLADDVIGVGLEAPFFLRALAPQLACATCALLLELRPHVGIAGTQTEQLSARVAHPIAIRGNADDPQVHTQHIGRGLLCWVREVGTDLEPPASLVVTEQVGFARVTAKRLVEWAPVDAVLVFEDLQMQRPEKGLTRGLALRRRLSLWQFSAIRTAVETKAEMAGIAVAFVNPAYTSQNCARCGLRGNRKRHSFTCPHCGMAMHADLNAAVNIRQRFVQFRLDAAPSVAAEALPLAGEGKPSAFS